MAEYSRLAKGSFTATGVGGSATTQFVNLPFQPDFVELWNYTNIKTAGANLTTRAYWDNRLLDGSNNPTMIQIYNGASAGVWDTIQTNGISSYAAGLSLQYGPVNAHGGSPVSDFSISRANPAVVTTVGNHGLNSGDVVVFSNLYQSATTGMQQIAGIAFTVTVTGATTFTIPWDTSNTTVYAVFNTATSTNNVGSYKKVLYPYLYAPGVSVISNITNGATTTIDTTTAHNFVVGQEVAIRIPSIAGVSPPAWGPTQFNSLPNTTIPGSPIYGYVIAVTDYNTVVVNINSTGYTAFNVAFPFASFKTTPAQIVAVGDVNTGGVQISANSALYPPPYTMPIGTTKVNTINGPAIQGAFFNNTSQGFFIGNGTGNVDTSSVIMKTGDIIYWHAYLHDFASP